MPSMMPSSMSSRSLYSAADLARSSALIASVKTCSSSRRVEPGLGVGAELVELVAAVLGLEVGQDRRSGLGHHRAAPGDHQRIVERLGQVREQCAHLRGGLEAVVRRQPRAVGRAEILALGDAHQRVVRLVHVGVGEEGLVGRDQRQVLGIGEVDQAALDTPFLLHAVARQLDVEPVPEGALEPLGQLGRRRGLAVGEQPPDRPGRAAGEQDQPLAVLFQRFQRHVRGDPRRHLEMGAGDQLEQVGVAGRVLGVDRHRVELGRAVQRPDRLGRLAHRELAADDRLDARLDAGLREFQRAEQVVGVGDRDRRHAVLPAQIGDLAGAQRALGQRIGGVDAEVDEIGVAHVRSTVLKPFRGRNILLPLIHRQQDIVRRSPAAARRRRRPGAAESGPSGWRAPGCGSPPGRRSWSGGRG